MSCVPGCLCVNRGTDYQHFDAAGSYECTCTAGRFEEYAFSAGVCADPACSHPRARHHDALPSAFSDASPSTASALGRIMEQSCLRPAKTPSQLERKEEPEPEAGSQVQTLENLLRPHAMDTPTLDAWTQLLHLRGITTAAEFHATHPSVLVEELGLPPACLLAWKGGRPLQIGGAGRKFRMDHTKDMMYQEAD
jgi:hypothetical protein